MEDLNRVRERICNAFRKNPRVASVNDMSIWRGWVQPLVMMSLGARYPLSDEDLDIYVECYMERVNGRVHVRVLIQDHILSEFSCDAIPDAAQ
jgi:hypothetical protein